MDDVCINTAQEINKASINIWYFNSPKQQNYLKSTLHPDLTFMNGSGISDELN